MKEYVTSQDWERFCQDKDLYTKFRRDINIDRVKVGVPFHKYISVGKLIRYLGKDLESMTFRFTKNWEVFMWDSIEEKHVLFNSKELIDALWMASRYKVKQL